MNVRPLPAVLQKMAEVELFETPQNLEHGIQQMKEWIAKQPHLRARTDDQWLAAFLRSSKYRVERAKEKLDLYYSLRSIAPDMFSLKHSNQRFLELFRSGITLVLPKRANPTDPRVVLIRSGKYDPGKYHISELYAVTLIYQQMVFMEDDAFMVAGTIGIMDFDGITKSHISQMTPTQIKRLVVCGQDASPIRLKGTHCMNMSKGVETILNIGKQFIKDKYKERLFVHNKSEDLYRYVSKDILPMEYGGNGGTIQEITDYWVQKLKNYDSWLEEDTKYGTDESKRPGKPKTSEDMFGVNGSFRQLDFD